jgi:hypothetical protein
MWETWLSFHRPFMLEEAGVVVWWNYFTYTVSGSAQMAQQNESHPLW